MLIADADRTDTASPSRTGDSVDERLFVDAVRRFSDDHLPCRGWYRMLQAGTGAGGLGVLLAERGYAVTVVEPDQLVRRSVERRLTLHGLDSNAEVVDQLPGSDRCFDAVFCFDPSKLSASAAAAVRQLRPRLRARGLLFGGPSFAEIPKNVLRREGLAAVNSSSEFTVFQARGKLRGIFGRVFRF
jgi:Methyltransferase domain